MQKKIETLQITILRRENCFLSVDYEEEYLLSVDSNENDVNLE